ncbi:unnamed protein product [Cochlearia groenlandica]
MHLIIRIKPIYFLFLILIASFSSSLAIVEGSIHLGGSKMHKSFMLYKRDEMKVKNMISHMRKLMIHSTADYDDAGPNPKHDPRRRSGGKP